jgi:hypothetical protein
VRQSIVSKDYAIRAATIPQPRLSIHAVTLASHSLARRCVAARPAAVDANSTRFLESPIATAPCPNSDRPAVFSNAHFLPVPTSLLAPRSRPSHRTSLSRRKLCASITPLSVPNPPPSAPPPRASMRRSSPLPCACSSTYLSLSFRQHHIQFRADLAEQVIRRHYVWKRVWDQSTHKRRNEFKILPDFGVNVEISI